MKKNLLVFVLFITAFLAAYLFVSSSDIFDDSPKKKIKTSGAKETLELWSFERAYPNDDIPSDAYTRAYEYSLSHFAKELKELNAADEWKQIGPHNIGGRTNAVAFNPQNSNTIFAGSASGGLWKSYTAGVGPMAWEFVETGFPVLGVSSISFIPNDSLTFYIGTGEVYNYQNALGGIAVRTTRGSYGIGILKTTDGGLTWTKSLDWSYNQQRGVQDVEVDQLNPTTVWAATTEGVYKSTDAGAAWNLSLNYLMAVDVEINPQNSDIVFATLGNLSSPNHGIYRTVDGGMNWTKLTNGLPASFGGKALLSIHWNNPQIVYVSIGNGFSSNAGTWLCKTTNGGDSWTIVNTTDYSTYQGWFSHFVAVHPVDPNLVLTAGVDVFKSTDGGANLVRKSDWAAWYFGITPPGGPEGPPNYSHADHHAFVFHPDFPDVVYFGNDGGVFRTLDFGETFEGCNGGYQSTQFYAKFTSSESDSLIAIGGMQDNATAIYLGTVAWKRVIGGDGCMTAIHPTNNNIMYGSSQNLSLRRTTNQGNNWTSISPPGSSPTAFVAPFVLSPSSPAILYAGRDKVFRSTNQGSNWSVTNNNQSLDGNPTIAMAISYSNAAKVYVSTAPVNSRARIFVTTDSGTTYSDITGDLPDRYPKNFAVDPNNDNNVYVVFSGFGTPHVYKSTNSGANWTDITGDLPDVPTSAIVVDSDYPQYIYVGNDIGVYVSTNSGATWNIFMEGIEDAAMVIDLSISPVNRKIRAVTHGRGVFERSLLEPSAVGTGMEIVLEEFRLEQNYPNPFNPATSIIYQIPYAGYITLKIYDALGREVTTLVNEQKPAGKHEVIFDASSAAGGLSSGVYFYTIETPFFNRTKKMIFTK